ncbi:4-alpha-glucanotransferase [Bovifimicola ammoniilytica]|jgi:4-alpha-glucanotransferase|uniref:4-alpha-glucanotransferase n=1 Tax=Bovifimicola ammoniilytica TaxID=2981720 RepID=UPI000822753F|nr:4-alpha-glucanotransferase [Bovifimicola ammoniilytica]MCU6754213.1 4-alpha-glucanotransferase [Bovifimicola ammoniilytica]SCJ82466.1 4-alpha-glucanotransferase [uncultured Eubacterium sp.]
MAEMMNEKKDRALKRGAGLLLPISSLPSPYGIGTLGKEAYKFVDYLVEAGQKYWQVLPVGPTSYGDSPYQSFSAFAGNPYFIDLDYLVEEGLITKAQIKKFPWGDNAEYIDYATVYGSRFQILRMAFNNSTYAETKEYAQFEKDNEYWLDDYSLYMAVKFKFDNQEWSKWDYDIKARQPEAIDRYKEELKDDIAFWKFCQFKFFEQWNKLRVYANESGIEIIGDIPIYVAMDSADVWAHKDLFELDEDFEQINVAGVPPDAFSEDGQLWGNPLYNWNRMEECDFEWWKQRMASNSKIYDYIRIDHFIGVVNYYSIEAGCENAKEGVWRQGPGKKLTDAIDSAIGDAKIIAEDLGIVSPAVRELLAETGYPGMNIIEFAFDGGPTNSHLPHNYKPNSLVYGGTHDNETVVGYFSSRSAADLKYAYKYLGVTKKSEIPAAVLRAAYASVAAIAIFQVQDILELGNEARMNTPSTVGDNWKWRMLKGSLTKKKAKELKELAEFYARL